MTNRPRTPPAEIETDLVLASDGAIYARFDEEPPAGRRVFTGYALTAEERAKHGTRGLLRWACLQLLALGSDGCVYVEDGVIEPEGRKEFRGYALTPEEAERLAREVHRTAFNVTIAAQIK
ncbi:hypothetical protein [Polyangium jinanense]|uniref:Uncharacterized protein n=1 Tax=Polyangium jinanense TaxID=2829994 RepID=A0A9X3XFT9_9BACT|nr:hypothetical protein [Polyangium jinanense]MDC3987311.1 hypothetical protein [Polyangium jinanense]